MVDPPTPADPSYSLFKEECDSIRDSLARKASCLHSRLVHMEGVTCQVADGALYLFPKIALPPAFIVHCSKSEGENVPPDTAYCLELLNATGICVVPGSGFGQVSRFTIDKNILILTFKF
jgi:alanine transaminase